MTFSTKKGWLWKLLLPRNKSSLSSKLCHVEPIVVHLPKHCDDVARAEGQLDLDVKMMMVAFMMITVDGGHLHVNIGWEFHGVVVVQGDHLLCRGVGVDVSPSIPLGGRIIRHSSFFSSLRWYLDHTHRFDFSILYITFIFNIQNTLNLMEVISRWYWSPILSITMIHGGL